jgi:triosephosphate isomerase
MSRLPYIAGNWKMNLTIPEAAVLAQEVAAAHAHASHRRVALFPAFVHLDLVRSHLHGSGVLLGAQNCHPAADGAFTGEVSTRMLKEAGVDVVLVGHSERRHVMGESDAFLADKLQAVLESGLQAMFCIGENLAERESGATFGVLARQLEALRRVKTGQAPQLSLAYEPVWAIGTGKTASAEQAQEAQAECRRLASGILGGPAGAALPILYGGSVKPANAASLLAQPDLDGLLVGGASLRAQDFLPILAAAPPR